jgi:hypothetical protein
MADKHGCMQLRVLHMERLMTRGMVGVVVRIFRPEPIHIEYVECHCRLVVVCCAGALSLCLTPFYPS